MKKAKIIAITAIAIICFAITFTFIKLSTPGGQRTDSLKSLEVVQLLTQLDALKMDYAVNLIANNSTSGFTHFDLSDYSLKPEQYIVIGQRENFLRNIQLASNEILITYGPGFDGLEAKTIRLAAIPAGDGVINWDCTGGNLSNKYRPQSCQKIDAP